MLRIAITFRPLRLPESADPRPMEIPDEHDRARVCFCRHVDAGTLVAAIHAGHITLDSLIEATGAATGCGTCRFDLVALLARFAPPEGST